MVGGGLSPEALAGLAWLKPGASSKPRESLARIEQLCADQATLFDAMFLVLATHATVPRLQLATAIKQFRRDAEAYSAEDLQGMLTALHTGAFQGFDAVLRTRKGADRKASALPFVRPD